MIFNDDEVERLKIQNITLSLISLSADTAQPVPPPAFPPMAMLEADASPVDMDLSGPRAAYAVEGTTVTEAELLDGSWNMLSLQKKFGRKPKSDNQGATRGTLLPPPSSPPATQPAAIVGADVTKKIKLTDFGVAQILHAVCTVQKIAEPVAIENDHLRIHPENNTFTISTPDEARARTYAALKSLSVGENTYEMNAYVPPPDDSRRGIVFNAYSYETDADIFDEFRKRNPNLNVVGGRRLGKSRHMIVTIAERELPRWIRYLGGYAQVVQRGHAPLKVAVATQTSFLDYRKPLQSPTPKHKIELPGRAVSAGGSTASSSQTTTPPALTGQQSLPVSGEGAQTGIPFTGEDILIQGAAWFLCHFSTQRAGTGSLRRLPASHLHCLFGWRWSRPTPGTSWPESFHTL
ncbi:hypothetical protein ISCGN_007514 [Ixodes scapularis]